MSFIIDPIKGVLGFGGRSGGARSVPQVSFGSGRSRITNAGVAIDPEVTALKQEGLGLAGDNLSRIQADRNQTIGDPNTFISRRTQGLRSTINEQGQRLGERLDRTGVTGEFGEQTKENFQESAKRKLASGEQLAFEEFNALASNFDQVEGGATQLLESINVADLAQQLQARGMSSELTKQLTLIAQKKQGNKDTKKQADKDMVGTLIMAAALFFSSRSFKHEIKSLDNQQILEKMVEVPVERWKYIWSDEEHIGCFAEDFNEHFGIKGDKTIKVVDVVGVLMASIQAQQVQIEELKDQLIGK